MFFFVKVSVTVWLILIGMSHTLMFLLLRVAAETMTQTITKQKVQISSYEKPVVHSAYFLFRYFLTQHKNKLPIPLSHSWKVIVDTDTSKLCKLNSFNERESQT